MPNDPIWPAGPLHNAADVPLSSNPGTLPEFADTIMGWFQLLTFEQVVKTVVNFQVTETTTPIQFQGCVLTVPKRSLKMTPSGQRLWRVKQLYCLPTVLIKPDDVVIYEGVQYRVAQSADYKQYGFMSYDLLEDYTGSGPEAA